MRIAVYGATGAIGSAIVDEARERGHVVTGISRRGSEVVGDLTGDALDAAYRRFLAINQELLGICTAWQLREVGGESVVNDHADATYDAGVIDQLAELDAQVQPIAADLGSALARFGRYGARLAEALAKVRAGDHDWFTKPMIASYHTVWFELHEDLLATLGIERSQEGSG